MEISVKLQCKHSEVPQSSISTSSFLLPVLFRAYIKPPVRINKMVNISVDYYQHQGCIFHISINYLGLYLSPKSLLNFLWNLYIPPCCEKFSTIFENALNLDIFTHASSLSLKTLSQLPNSFPRQCFYKNLFTSSIERDGGNYDLLHQNSIRKYIWWWLMILGYLYFVWFLQMWWLCSFVNDHKLNNMVLILLPLLCNHDNLIIKLHQTKNSCLDKKWLFMARFKVRSVPGMINSYSNI